MCTSKLCGCFRLLFFVLVCFSVWYYSPLGKSSRRRALKTSELKRAKPVTSNQQSSSSTYTCVLRTQLRLPENRLSTGLVCCTTTTYCYCCTSYIKYISFVHLRNLFAGDYSHPPPPRPFFLWVCHAGASTINY